MTSVRIVADDLTGALDAAAPFAAALGPVPVLWEHAHLDAVAGSFAVSSESRERTAAALPDALRALAAADIAFKKIDSLLRGTTPAEVATCLACGLFRSAVIAPAFPAQQRITRGGLQYWRQAPDENWSPVACDLAAEVRRRGAGLRSAERPVDLSGAGFFLCDAESDQELDGIALAGAGLERPLLWVGTAGLARALAGSPAFTPPGRLERPLLIVVGSHHPVSLRQVEALGAVRGEAVARLQIGDDAPVAIEQVARGLERRGLAALVLSVPDGTGASVTAPWFAAVLGQMAARLARPGSLVVTGGATLMQLVRALGGEALDVHSELVPGIAVSCMRGGRWPGAMVVSKSGAFGEPELLARLVER